MIKFNILKVSFFIVFLLIFQNSSFAKLKSEIIFKINEDIITNIDLDNESKFLIFLNPSLNNLSKNKMENISLESLKNRKIKEIELKKYYDLTNNEISEKLISNFILSSNLNDKNNFINKLNEINLEYSFFEKNFLIDNLWRQYIFERFKSQVKIDVEELKKELKNQNNEIEELNLSEILFQLEPGKTLDELGKQILSEIDKSGFEVAASIYSTSDSKNYGGKLGWIKSSQISKKIYSEIKNNNNISKPIKTKNGYLIIKVNETRNILQKIDFEEELTKLKNIETEKELNKLGYIYFNKIKKRVFISEN